MLKSSIRKQVLQQRIALADEDFLMLNEQLLAQFKTLDFAAVKSIHVFLPIVKKREPNTYLFVEWLHEQHPEIVIVISRSNFEGHSMSHHPYLGKADLRENRYHIPEPQTSQLFLGKIDMVLVPLLAFDYLGHRVGYGKGFYDRFLASTEAQKVGISLFGPVEEISDVHADDIKLDFCVSPDQVYRF